MKQSEASRIEGVEDLPNLRSSLEACPQFKRQVPCYFAGDYEILLNTRPSRIDKPESRLVGPATHAAHSREPFVDIRA
jgi:hypothetical protein